VVVDAKALQDLATHLLSELVLGERTVGPEGADEADLILLDSPLQELANHDRPDLVDPRRAGHVIEDDNGLLLAPRQLAKAGGADRLVDGLRHFSRAQPEAPGAAHGAEFDLPVVGKIQLQGRVLVPDQLGQVDSHEDGSHSRRGACSRRDCAASSDEVALRS
jgi:hypothetical protein